MPSETDAFITVKARLWNSTLVADYPRVDQVTIVSSIQISIPDVYNIHQLNGDDQGFVRNIHYLSFFLFEVEVLMVSFCFIHTGDYSSLSRS